MESMELVIIGAGPAGLGAAYEAVRRGVRPLIVEQDSVIGGLSRTVEHQGFRFDIGGHRFYDKYPEVTQTWSEMLGDDWLTQERLSRIRFSGRFFSYPLKPAEALLGLGPWRSLKAVGSYVWAQGRRRRESVSFEDAIVSAFGGELYRTFFKTYTEKVWGLECSRISRDMASARIKGFTLGAALKAFMWRGTEARTASSTFYYPRLGPGQLWDIYRARIEAGQGRFALRTRAEQLRVEEGRVTGVRLVGPEGERWVNCGAVVSSMPLAELCGSLRPAPPEAVQQAAEGLLYRAFIEVVLILQDPEPFPDTWIYVHDPGVKLGRVQNYKKWSPAMVPDPGTTCLGLEYFCFEGDDLWSATDEALAALGLEESARIGLVNPERVRETLVVRMPKAYPVYDLEYLAKTDRIAEYLAGIGNLRVAGRNGQHRYFTQDESVLAGAYAVRGLAGEGFDPWQVQTAEY